MAIDLGKKASFINSCGAAFVVAVLLCFCRGCKHEPEGAHARRVTAMNACISTIHCETAPEYSRRYAQEALDNWTNGKVDPEPILIYASAGEGIERPVYLSLEMSDEQSDIIGLTIKEIKKNGDQAVLIEEYPAFVHAKVGHHQIIPVVERTAGQRKDSAEWEAYVRKGEWEGRPPIYLSLPKGNEIEVFINVYDRHGLASEPVPLEKHLLKFPSFEELERKGVKVEY